MKKFSKCKKIDASNTICNAPDGETKFIPIIFVKLKLCLSDKSLTAFIPIPDDFFLCNTNLGKMDMMAVAPPKIKELAESV